MSIGIVPIRRLGSCSCNGRATLVQACAQHVTDAHDPSSCTAEVLQVHEQATPVKTASKKLHYLSSMSNGATAAFRHMPDQHQQPRAARLPTIYGVRCFAEYWGARGCSRNIYVIRVINSGRYQGGDQRTIDATAYSGHTQPTIAVLNATYQPMR